MVTLEEDLMSLDSGASRYFSHLWTNILVFFVHPSLSSNQKTMFSGFTRPQIQLRKAVDRCGVLCVCVFNACVCDQDVSVSPRVISTPLPLSEPSQHGADWMHQSEKNSDFHTFRLTCAQIKIKSYAVLFHETASELAPIFIFSSTRTWTDKQRPLLSEGGEREKWTMND